MKKGRPAHTVHVLVRPADVDAAAPRVLLAETGTLGVRASSSCAGRSGATRSTVEVDGHTIRVKVAGGRVKVEHDDAAAAARHLGRPLRDVLREAETRALGEQNTT